jgi:hypothetical protein
LKLQSSSFSSKIFHGCKFVSSRKTKKHLQGIKYRKKMKQLKFLSLFSDLRVPTKGQTQAVILQSSVNRRGAGYTRII